MQKQLYERILNPHLELTIFNPASGDMAARGTIIPRTVSNDLVVMFKLCVGFADVYLSVGFVWNTFWLDLG